MASIKWEGLEGTARSFLSAYSGYFDNKKQSEEDSAIPFSSKTHIPVTMPEIGDHVFFVKEQVPKSCRCCCMFRFSVLRPRNTMCVSLLLFTCSTSHSVSFPAPSLDSSPPGHLTMPLSCSHLWRCVQTDAGPQRGGLQSRLKVANVLFLNSGDSVGYFRIVAKHFEFTDPEAALKVQQAVNVRRSSAVCLP